MSVAGKPIFNLTGRRVFVAGHRGMVGSALVRRLAREECEILTASRAELDLERQADVEAWLADKRPSAIFLAAAKVGGIVANDTRPAEFIYDNLAIQNHVIEGARRIGVDKLMFLGSSCIYPRLSPAIWLRLHLGDADECLWPGRQFPPHAQPCGRGADRQDPPRQATRRADGRDLGHREAAPRVPLCRRSRRCD